MADETIREPEQIRADCARKLRTVETGGMFTAILGCLLGEDWSTPQIEEVRITPDRCLLARVEGEVNQQFVLPRSNTGQAAFNVGGG